MKKVIFISVLFLVIGNVFAFSSNSKCEEQEDVVFVPVKDNPIDDHGGPAKSPAAPIYASFYGNTLTFDKQLSGSLLYFYSSENDVTSVVIDVTGNATIPSYIVGEVRILLKEGNRQYYAILEL